MSILIDNNTRVICQGFTGKNGTFHSQAKVAKFGESFDWHAHEKEDEAFLVLRGRIAIDFRDGSVELGSNDFIVQFLPVCYQFIQVI